MAKKEIVLERTEKREKLKEVKNYIYIGPNWIEKGLTTNKLFKAELGANEEKLIKEYPIFKSLFIETKDINKLEKIKIKGSIENISYAKALKVIGGK